MLPSLDGFAEEMGGRVIYLGGTTCTVNMSDILSVCVFSMSTCETTVLFNLTHIYLFVCNMTKIRILYAGLLKMLQYLNHL